MWQWFGILTGVLPNVMTAGASVVREDRAKFAQPRFGRLDVVLLLVYALASGVYSGTTFSLLDRRFLIVPTGNDVWFEADMPIVADTILHRWTDQGRNARHPLFPLVTTVPAYGLKMLGVGERERLLAIVVASAALWSAAVFALLRLLVPTRLDAGVFTLLAHVSAAGMFSLPTLETNVLGSTTLLAPLMLVAWDIRCRRSDAWYAAASALALSMTTSSWISGIVAVAVSRRARDALQITVNALAIVVALWAVLKTLVPPAPFFIEAAQPSRFLFAEAAGGPIARVRALLFHTLVMPAAQILSNTKWGDIMSVQRAALGTSGAIGVVATVLWTALLVAGVAALLWGDLDRRLRLALTSTLLAQGAIVACYGEETFLYGLYVAPLLVASVAAAATSKHGRWVTLGAAALAVLLAINNGAALAEATRFFVSGPRYRVQPL